LKVSVAHEGKRPMPVTLSRDLVMAGTSRASHSNDRANIDTAKKVQKVGRNDPCPCGSGKKYKYCCGRNA